MDIFGIEPTDDGYAALYALGTIICSKIRECTKEEPAPRP